MAEGKETYQWDHTVAIVSPWAKKPPQNPYRRKRGRAKPDLKLGPKDSVRMLARAFGCKSVPQVGDKRIEAS